MPAPPLLRFWEGIRPNLKLLRCCEEKYGWWRGKDKKVDRPTPCQRTQTSQSEIGDVVQLDAARGDDVAGRGDERAERFVEEFIDDARGVVRARRRAVELCWGRARRASGARSDQTERSRVRNARARRIAEAPRAAQRNISFTSPISPLGLSWGYIYIGVNMIALLT